MNFDNKSIKIFNEVITNYNNYIDFLKKYSDIDNNIKLPRNVEINLIKNDIYKYRSFIKFFTSVIELINKVNLLKNFIKNTKNSINEITKAKKNLKKSEKKLVRPQNLH